MSAAPLSDSPPTACRAVVSFRKKDTILRIKSAIEQRGCHAEESQPKHSAMQAYCGALVAPASRPGYLPPTNPCMCSLLPPCPCHAA
ncbi:hypothetical protein HaLaN_02916 [Haematococcus lacustris]|uniref:Uncharacterized protein n=1 Tax=Haematococcus lacustris TaxID=44745 RepID=A0A699YF03_HAELA|nr:hypothetical protein HaLaN_02916 [Haematococcus lacustris]